MPTGVLNSQKESRLPSAFQHATADIQTDGMRVAGVKWRVLACLVEEEERKVVK